jgi:hypothetical protein
MPRFQTQIKMIRHFGRIMRTPIHRLMYRVFMWDRQLNTSGQNSTWSKEIKTILFENILNQLYELQQMFPAKNITIQLQSSMLISQQNIIKNECESKPKLRTFMVFYQLGWKQLNI